MNKKHIIIFGTLILLSIIILGGITYYREKSTQEEGLDTVDIKHSIPNFSYSYPLNFDEFLSFIDFCSVQAINSEELENKEIKEIYCSIGQKPSIMVNGQIRSASISNSSSSELDLFYLPSFLLLSLKDSFNAFDYIGISLDLKDVIKRYDPSLLEEEALYFCSVSEPLWLDTFSFESIYTLPDSIMLGFDEGDVWCKLIKLNEYSIETFAGFTPEAESLGIKEYLVDEKTIVNIKEKLYNQSFLDIKNILENYPIVWQMEKPINF